jgi:dTDP-4-amino-4,6-dideoxygalactose transaminase
MQIVHRVVPAIAGGHPVRRDYLVFGRPVIGEEEIAEVVEVLRSGWIGTGPRTARFEEEFGSYTGARHAVAVSSCTAALHLSLAASKLAPGDEVVVPSMTFVASANSIVHAGATPVLCDVDPGTQNLGVEYLQRVLTPKTRAIMPVHFAGRAVDMTALNAVVADWIARHGRDVSVISDAAHAIETEHAGRRMPAYAPLTAYSFYPTKNLTTAEGGMVATNDDALAERLRVLRLHGLSADAWKRFSDEGFRHYEAIEAGYKYNLTDLQAAIGLHQLRRLESASARRAALWSRYLDAFADLPMDLPPPSPRGDRHAHHLFIVLLRLDALSVDRDRIAQALHAEGIGIGIHYRAVHLHPYYRQRFGYEPEAFPNARAISERTLSLPLSAGLSDRDADDVIEAVRRVVTYFRR